MQIHVFKLPDIGEGTAEAELVAWHVRVGDQVEEDQPVADVMTDKATVEITSPVSGRIAALHGTVGEASPVGSPLVEFEIDDGDEVPALPVPQGLASALQAAAQPKDRNSPKTTPAVRRRAKELGVALEEVAGSGPHGRIRQGDLDAFLSARSGEAAEQRRVLIPPQSREGQQDSFDVVRLTGLRRRIAEKMESSTRQIPHFAYIEQVDVTEIEATRALLNERHGAERGRLSLLPFLVQAICRVVPRFPQINATYDEQDGMVRQYNSVHVGIATQTEQGLMVPVIKQSQQLGLWDLANEIGRLAAAARNGSAKREELSGSTITITSLGTLGGIATTPVINQPEVAIIGPNRIVEQPIVRNGAVEVRKIMNISSSFDHRVVDGFDAARFIQEVKSLIEAPGLLLAR